MLTSILRIRWPGWGALAGLIAIGGGVALAAESWDIDLEYPSFQGDFYVAGSVSFPPGSVRTEEQLLIQAAESGAEIPTCIRGVQAWPDGSLRRAEVLFPANNSRPTAHRLLFGDDVKRSRVFSQTAVLPAVAFSVRGAPRSAENMDLSVGTINIRVDRSSRIYYYWHLAPILLIIGLTWYRTRRVAPRDAGQAPRNA